MKTIRIFVSSPGDVAAERLKAADIFERLQAEFSGRLLIEAYFWEHEPMLAHTDFQTQIEPPSQFDLFVCILWARLGSRLHPAMHRKPDGTEYASGTEFEVLDALEGFRRSGAPEVLVYKRKGDPIIPAKPKEQRDRILEQYDLLDSFFTKLTQEDGYYVVGTNSYAGLDQFENKFETAMRKVFNRMVPAGVSGSSIPLRSWTTGSPFRGLRHFDFEHAAIFFGRTRAVDELLTSLQKQAANDRTFVLVFGGSGVGKSSLVRAGLLPWLVRPGVIDGVGIWRRAIMRPADTTEGDLFDGLSAALLRPEALPELTSDGTDATRLAKLLRENPAGLPLLIKGALSQAAREIQLRTNAPKQPRALFALVIDQLEELFTIERFSRQREGLFQTIDALARSGYVWVIATLRSDFYSRCEESPVLMQLKQGDGQYHLQPPDEVSLGQMIRLPASAAGVLFEEDHGTGERLDDILRDAAVKNPAALPLLEFALEELYEQRDRNTETLRLDAYRQLGGVEGALARKADQSLAAASRAAQDKFDQVFRHLVTVGGADGHPAARRRAVKSQVATDTSSEELIDRLVDDRLLVTERNEDGAVLVSIAHEALLDSWPRLAKCVAFHRENLEIRAQISTDAARWVENNHDADYLYAGGAPLDKAKSVWQRGFLAGPEVEFVKRSLANREEREFRASLVSGEGIEELSNRLRNEWPEVRVDVLGNAFRSEQIMARRHAAALIGDEKDQQLADQLPELLLKEPIDEVRCEAARSLIEVDDPKLFTRILQRLGSDNGNIGAWTAAAELRSAADTAKHSGTFEPVFRDLNRSTRSKIQARARLLRFQRGMPALFFVLIPAILLSCLSAAAFKWIPGLFNFALCQATANPIMACFHGCVAAVIWGGSITCGVATYHIVLGTEWGVRSYLRPFGAIVAGAISGFLSSIAVVLMIVSVYTDKALFLTGWAAPGVYDKFDPAFWRQLWWGTRFPWAYLIMGTSLGIGMAQMANALRKSSRWPELINQVGTALSGVRQAERVVLKITRLGLRYAWPIPVCLAIGSVLAFAVLRSAPLAESSHAETWTAVFTGGMARANDPATADRMVREWKMGPWGEGLGIAGDAMTQAIGGFFALIGMGFGIVVRRYGLKIEPQKN